MRSIAFAEILTILYVLVDDWYQQMYRGRRQCGRRARLSDSEVLTLMLAQEFLPYASERQYLAHLRANYRALFPELTDQSQYNRRCRRLGLVLDLFRQALLATEWHEELIYLLLDCKPIAVVGYKRDKRKSDHWGMARYGRCVARALYYWGYKLVMLTTASGMPLLYELVPADTGDQQAAQEVVYAVENGLILCDKGFIGRDWLAELGHHTATQLLVPPRKNQTSPLPPRFWAWVQSRRQRIEGVFAELQEHGRNIEHLRAKTLLGLRARLIAKIAAYSCARVLATYAGLDLYLASAR